MRLLFRFWLPHIPTRVRVPSELTRARARRAMFVQSSRERERERNVERVPRSSFRPRFVTKEERKPRITRCDQRVKPIHRMPLESRDPFFSFFSSPLPFFCKLPPYRENKRTALPYHKSLFRLIRTGGGVIETCRDYNGEHQKMKRTATES